MLNNAYIDLRKLKNNALTVRKKLPKNVKFCAVVKADAYGHGAEIVAATLYNIVDCFAVALVEEGISLRLSGINKEILVLIPCQKTDLERAVYYNLTLTVTSISDVLNLEKEAKRQNRKVIVHVKINTGMNRQGVDNLYELEKILDRIQSLKHVGLGGGYSHFAEPENKKSLICVQNAFLLANNLVKRYNNKAILHVSASGGFLQGAYFDMVRIGILLYGYKPFESDKISVSPVMKVCAPILTKRRIKKGESMLYGNCPSSIEQDVSLVRYGYADGLARKNILGQFNNRCMDLTALTSFKRLNGEAVIMDDAESLAKEYGTISYEILTSVASRAQKIYIR